MNLRKWGVAGAAILLAAMAGASVTFRPDRAIRIATGVVAHDVCSKTFVSGFDPQAVFSETVERDGLRRLRKVLRWQIDRT
ncbi:MAG: serine hydrolase, partial [Bradyrhizobium sp.]